jgi:hypothetical protein
LHSGEFGARTSYAIAVDGETLLVDPLVDGDDDPALARSTILSAAACGSSSASRSIPAAPSLELDVSLCAVRLRRATFLPS